MFVKIKIVECHSVFLCVVQGRKKCWGNRIVMGLQAGKQTLLNLYAGIYHSDGFKTPRYKGAILIM